MVKTGHSSFDGRHENRLLMLLIIEDMFDNSQYGVIEFNVLVQSAFSIGKYNQRPSKEWPTPAAMFLIKSR